MARQRASGAAAPLVVSVLIPLAVIAVAIAVLVSVVASGGGRRAADKELDARAQTVKKAWDAVGQPSGASSLRQLGKRLDAKLVVVHGQRPAAGKTSGDTRSYAFAARHARALRVAL